MSPGRPSLISLHRLLHREPGADGALGVVLVGDRRAEDGHHVVADVLVDPAAEADHLLAELAQGAVEHRLDGLGVHPLGDGRVAGEVGEEDRDLAPLLRRRPRAAGRPRRFGRRPAPRPAPAASSAVPHSTQNLAPGGTSAPQLGQRRSSAAPQDMQKRARSGFSVPQAEQVSPHRHRVRQAHLGAGSMTVDTRADRKHVAVLTSPPIRGIVRTSGIFNTAGVPASARRPAAPYSIRMSSTRCCARAALAPVVRRAAPGRRRSAPASSPARRAAPVCHCSRSSGGVVARTTSAPRQIGHHSRHSCSPAGSPSAPGSGSALLRPLRGPRAARGRSCTLPEAARVAGLGPRGSPGPRVKPARAVLSCGSGILEGDLAASRSRSWRRWVAARRERRAG